MVGCNVIYANEIIRFFSGKNYMQVELLIRELSRENRDFIFLLTHIYCDYVVERK